MDKEFSQVYSSLIYAVESCNLETVPEQVLSDLMQQMVAVRVVCTPDHPEALKQFMPYYQKVFLMMLKRKLSLPPLPMAFNPQGQIIYGKEELLWLFSNISFEKMLNILDELIERLLKNVSNNLILY